MGNSAAAPTASQAWRMGAVVIIIIVIVIIVIIIIIIIIIILHTRPLSDQTTSISREEFMLICLNHKRFIRCER